MMSDQPKVPLVRLPSGVPGLDEVLGGGIPAYSFNLISGQPGAGKTTLAHQIMFANATPERPAMYITLLGEPPIKMLRYQQQLAFFETRRVGQDIHFVNLGRTLADHGLRAVLDELVQQVNALEPSIVIVDSFQTVSRMRHDPSQDMSLQTFVERLATHLSSWEVTSFLIGEYAEGLLRDNPVFTIADGLIGLTQQVDENAVVRKLQVLKIRGQGPLPGLHSFRITSEGLRVFPRILSPSQRPLRRLPDQRLSTGLPVLDGMLGGGLPQGDSVLVSGPSGTGKSVLSTHFLDAGLRQGEPGLLVMFEERPDEYLTRSAMVGFDLETPLAQGLLTLIDLHPLDLSPDEILFTIRETVERTQARRVVIDSLTGFEVAIPQSFKTEFRQSLYRLIEVLNARGVTVVTTIELPEELAKFQFSPNLVSFLADTVISQRYVELAGVLERVILVGKMRRSAHSRALHRYEITTAGYQIGEVLSAYEGLITGVARLRAPSGGPAGPSPGRDGPEAGPGSGAA